MWSFQDRRQGREIRAELELHWEVMGDPISDDYTPDEADARELWRLWLDPYGRGEHDARPGPGWVQIYWTVQATAEDLRTSENAPHAYAEEPPGEDFLTHFTWPRDDQTGEDLRWPALPVCDKFWNDERADKGGFIQEATGWKPGAYQPLAHPFARQGSRAPFLKRERRPKQPSRLRRAQLVESGEARHPACRARTAGGTEVLRRSPISMGERCVSPTVVSDLPDRSFPTSRKTVIQVRVRPN